MPEITIDVAMKSVSTIRRQIARLRKIADNKNNDPQVRRVAVETYHALQWVIGEAPWAPANLLEGIARLTNQKESDA